MDEASAGGQSDSAVSNPRAAAVVESTASNLQTVAIDDFEAGLIAGRLDYATLASGFGQLKNVLLSILGRMQGAKTTLNAMTGEVLGIISLINQGVRTPRELAMTLFNAGASIAGGILEIKNSIALYGRTGNTASSGSGAASGGGASGGGNSSASRSASSSPSLPPPDNEKNTLTKFLSAAAYALPIETATVSQKVTKTAVENLYRTMAFLTSVRILASQDSLSYKKAEAYWRLMEKLEESINRENPAVYTALRDLRTALSQKLSGQSLRTEMSRGIFTPAPLLYLAYYLGCDEDKIRELNTVADSFVIEGNVVYV
jgi:hypothetical protein